MIEPKRPKGKTVEKKPTPTNNQTTQSPLNSPSAPPEMLTQGNQTPDAQNVALQRMPTAQQHHLMRQMGQIQGNQYTQRLVTQMKPAPTQRQTPDVQTSPAPAPTVIGTATIVSTTLNVRRSPEFTSQTNIIGKFKKGDKVDVVEKGDYYMKISYYGGVAYIGAGPQYVTYTGKSAAEPKEKDDNKDKPEKQPNIFQSIFNWVSGGIKGLFDWIGGGIKKLGSVSAGGKKEKTADNKGIAGLEEMLKTLEGIQAEDTQVIGKKSYALWTKIKKKGEAETEGSVIAESNLHKETDPDQAAKAVELIKKAREIVGALTVADIGGDEKTLTQRKADYYRRLNKLSPYYTQIANKAILSKAEGVYKGSWWRTCNVTSLSMALNGLGIGPADFQGDKELLKKIAQQLGVPQDQLDSLTSWRMADFVQLVAVYYFYVKKHGTQFDANKVEARRAQATEDVLSIATLGGIGKLFGATFTSKEYGQTYGAQNSKTKKLTEKHQARIKNLNSEVTTVQGEIAQLEKEGPATLVALNGKTNYQVWEKPDSADRTEYEKRRAERATQVTSHNTLEKQYNGKKEGEKPALATVKGVDEQIVAADGIMVSKLQNEIDKRLPDELQTFKDNNAKLKAFKDNIIQEVGSKMNNGDQVYSNVPGHYVRIEDINEGGIVIDDPAWGKNTSLTWEKTYDAGYFRFYHILSK